MTAELFTNWLIQLDKRMKKEKRKIILFIDNCTAHSNIPSLQSIKVQFLSPNTTSKLQPLDQGIIKNFKILYRKEIVRSILSDIEEEKNTSITILQAIKLADKSWRNVSQQTIINCFKICGFSLQKENFEEQSGPVINHSLETERPSFITLYHSKHNVRRFRRM